MPKIIPQDTIERMRDLRRQGVTVRGIADEVGVSPMTIAKYAGDIPPPQQRRPQRKPRPPRSIDNVTEAEIKRMQDLRRAGVVVAEIARLTGRAMATVTRYTVELRETLSKDDIACIRHLRAEGFSVSTIAAEYQCSARIIREYTADVVVKPKAPLITDQKAERMRQLRADGWSLERISRQIGVCIPIVREHTRCVSARPRGPLVIEIGCLFCHRSISVKVPEERQDAENCYFHDVMTCSCGQSYLLRDLVSVEEFRYRWEYHNGGLSLAQDTALKVCYVATQ